jgi:tetratricopeptide (TPR) repeat protein
MRRIIVRIIYLIMIVGGLEFTYEWLVGGATNVICKVGSFLGAVSAYLLWRDIRSRNTPIPPNIAISRNRPRWKVLVPVAGIIFFIALVILFTTHKVPDAANNIEPYDPIKSWIQCNDDRPNQRIIGCTAIISGSQEPPTRLAIAFINRGSAQSISVELDDDQAISLMDQAIKANPDDASAFYHRGLAHAAKSDACSNLHLCPPSFEKERAIADYDQAIKLDANNPNYFYRRGLVYKTNDQSLRDYEQAIKLDPDFVEAINSRGILWAFRGQYDRAIQDYDQVIKLDPNYYGAFYNRAIAHAASGQYERAIHDYDQAISLDPITASDPRYEADPRKRIRVYWAICSPPSEGVWLPEGGHPPRWNILQDCIGPGRHIPLDEPSCSWRYELRIAGCTAIIDSGQSTAADIGLAIEEYNQTIAANPNDYRVFYNRGNAYLDKNEYDLAVADYDHAISLKPDYSTAFGQRGLIYYRKGEYDRAIEDLDHALRLEPPNSFARTNLLAALNGRAQALANRGEYDRAIQDYDRALKIFPGDVEALKGRGNTYKAAGQHERATQDFDRAVNRLLELGRSSLERGRNSLDFKDFDRALTTYEDALKLNPKSAAALYGRGLVKRAMDDNAGADADIAAAIQIKPDVANDFGSARR